MASPHPAPPRPKPGGRGAQTRARLMDAARTMLKAASPIELTAISVARVAKTAPPSFYVYFADTRGLLLALADDAAADLMALARHFEPPLWPLADTAAWALAFVDDFVAVWDRHSEVLAVRNLEADRGDRDFDEARVRASLPVLAALADRMFEARGKAGRRVDAFAEAVIHYATLERLASIEHTTHVDRLQPHHYKAAMVRILTASLAPRA